MTRATDPNNDLVRGERAEPVGSMMTWRATDHFFDLSLSIKLSMSRRHRVGRFLGFRLPIGSTSFVVTVLRLLQTFSVLGHSVTSLRLPVLGRWQLRYPLCTCLKWPCLARSHAYLVNFGARCHPWDRYGFAIPAYSDCQYAIDPPPFPGGR